MAFFPCSASFPAMLADMYSNAFNGAHFNWICSPAVTELETVMMDWLAQALALPDCFLSTGPTRGGGVIQGTASEAILTAMVAARDKFLRSRTAHLAEDSEEKEDETWRLRSKLVALGSDMTHSSTKKAAKILGVRFDTVPVSRATGYAMTAESLANKLRDLRAKGLEPFYLTATLGTTDTCAIDDLEGIVALLKDESLNPNDALWVHLDAAYAGAALICPEHQTFNAHLAHFHTVDFNPHKWLLTNFDCSALWVRNRAWLTEALSVNPAYLRNDLSDAGLVTDYRDWQIPLGRRFRSLKLWFLMRTYGIEGLRAHVRGGIARGDLFANLVAGRTDLFEVIAGPSFALVVLSVAGGADEEESDLLTKRVYDAISAEGEFFLTSSVLKGLYAIRVCVSGANVGEDEVRRVFDALVRCTEEVTGRKKQEAA